MADVFHGLLPENARRSEKAKLIKPQHLDSGGEGYVVTFAIQGPSRSVSFEASSGIYIFCLQTDISGIATLTMY